MDVTTDLDAAHPEEGEQEPFVCLDCGHEWMQSGVWEQDEDGPAFCVGEDDDCPKCGSEDTDLV